MNVLLVATGDKETAFTPYKQGEVFGVPEADANKILSNPKYKNSVRKFDPDKDQGLLDAMEGTHPSDMATVLAPEVKNKPKAKSQTQLKREAADQVAKAKAAEDAKAKAEKAS